jgi:WD40 repeat protein
MAGEKTARLWDAVTGQPRSNPLRQAGPAHRASFSPDGRIAWTLNEEGTFCLWTVATGKPLTRLVPHPGAVSAVAFSPDSRLLVTGSKDTTARLWDLTNARSVGEPLRHLDEILAVAFSPDGEQGQNRPAVGNRHGQASRRTAPTPGRGPRCRLQSRREDGPDGQR